MENYYTLNIYHYYNPDTKEETNSVEINEHKCNGKTIEIENGSSIDITGTYDYEVIYEFDAYEKAVDFLKDYIKENEYSCEEIASLIDKVSEIKKKFALWYLLREYHNKELKIPENPSTVDEYKEMVFKRDLNVAVNHIIEILGYELWG